MGSEMEDSSDVGKDSKWKEEYKILRSNRLIQEKNMGSDSVILFLPENVR